VYVSESGCDGKVIINRTQTGVGFVHFGRLCVEGGIVDVGIVHAIFFTTGDTQFDFQGHANLGHALEILFTGRQVFFQWLSRQVDHVGTEQRTAELFEVAFVLFHQSIDPGQQFAGRVIGVQDNRNAVGFCHGFDVVCTGNGANDILVFCRTAFAGIKHRHLRTE